MDETGTVRGTPLLPGREKFPAGLTGAGLSVIRAGSDLEESVWPRVSPMLGDKSLLNGADLVFGETSSPSGSAFDL